jgi:hypothetical protein
MQAVALLEQRGIEFSNQFGPVKREGRCHASVTFPLNVEVLLHLEREHGHSQYVYRLPPKAFDPL